jgi:ribonuclease-3 family protein
MTPPDPAWSTQLMARLWSAPWAAETPSVESSPSASAPAQIQQLSPQALAYIGDAVFELFIRGCYLLPPRRLQTYHQQVVNQVRAEQQAASLQTLLPHLTSEETAILKQGRNAAPSRGRRADAAVYGQATGFEALLGYLYLKDPERLTQLLQLLL